MTERDTFGVGWARAAQQQLVPFLRQRLKLGLDTEDAVERYYNFSITKWLNATLDLQVIDPAFKFLDSSNRLQNMNTSVGGRPPHLLALLAVRRPPAVGGRSLVTVPPGGRRGTRDGGGAAERPTRRRSPA